MTKHDKTFMTYVITSWYRYFGRKSSKDGSHDDLTLREKGIRDGQISAGRSELFARAII